ncbi:hypothetical protein Q8G41_27750, partial [Klebsiella pneumoniae]|uniref:hypothetical protein n=1 Tax=Klebsiella pneumoniae TaxID=573 RepID=UPI003013E001
MKLDCADKFGRVMSLPDQDWLPGNRGTVALNTSLVQLQKDPRTGDPSGFYEYVRPAMRDAGFQYVTEILEELKVHALKGQEARRY